MNIRHLTSIALCFITKATCAQEPCKVLLNAINVNYKGECKKGLAHGQGEASGAQKYIGEFKDGLPNGNGTYFFDDSAWYVGAFQDGILEGKGEMHNSRITTKDSIIKGYWSGGEYRGKTYVTYTTDAQTRFDRVEASASKVAGDRVSIEISTTSGSPNNSVKTYAAGVVINLDDLIAPEDNSAILFLSESKTANKATWTYQVKKFPIKLRGRTSNGDSFNFELYKSANWLIRLYLNR